jgi:flagellar export protein FliJ
MSKFNYKYESIKNVKKNLEKKSQKELAAIDVKIEKVNKDIRELERKKNQIIINEASNKTIKISEIHSKINYENYLNEMINMHQKMLNIYKDERKEKLEVLVAKSKEHKIFKTLEEKTYQEFIFEDNKLLQNQLDDISVQKYVRGKN